MCAAAYPTSALAFQQDTEAVLWWEPTRCVGCRA